MTEAKQYSGRLFLVTAPSGAGKSSLVNALLKMEPDIKLSISHTTRAPRPGEENGREYHFVTVEEFEAMKARGDFLESALVHGNYYGTSRVWIEEQMSIGNDVLLEIDWQGARQVRERFAGTVGIFILPPSIEALEWRLHHRGTDSVASAPPRHGFRTDHHTSASRRRGRNGPCARIRVRYNQRRF